MKPGIRISKIWFDDDVIELNVCVSDGTSFFSNQVYIGYAALVDTVSDLNAFKTQVHGGLLDVRFGGFGPEWANGAFHARFHSLSPGHLYVSCEQESGFEDFAKKTVASRATMYLRSQPVLLDRFIAELEMLASGESEEAYLEGV